MNKATEILEQHEPDIIYCDYQDARPILLQAITDAQKEAATEFFKWHWKNYSSHPNEEEVEERYEVFLNSFAKI